MLQFSDNLWRFFIFSNYIGENKSLYVGPFEKVRHLTLDLLKSLFLWSIERRPQWTRVETLNCRQNPVPTEKYCNWIRNKAFLIHFSWFFNRFTNNKSFSRYQNYTDQKFHNFTVYVTIFGQCMAAFHFF